MMSLRPYQVDAVRKVRAAYTAGCKRVLLVLATGAGKTVVASEIIRLARLNETSVTFLAHRVELIEQTIGKLREVGIEPGVIKAGYAPTPLAPVQVASIQTLARRGIGGGGFLIVDEAHHAASDTYRRTASQYRYVLGLTATPWRTDGRGLEGDFDAVVVAATPSELASDGYLVTPECFQYASPDLKGIRLTDSGDFSPKMLQLLVDRQELQGDVVREYQLHGNGEPGIVFPASVEASQRVVSLFNAKGFEARHVDGDTPPFERDDILKRFTKGQLQILSSCGVLTEGFDAPIASVCMIARPTQSLSLFLQMCLDERTEVLTRRGWLGPDEIDNTDLVAAMDTKTGTASWEPILSRVDRPLSDEEEMLAISSPTLDIRVTGGHTMVWRGRRQTGWRKDTADTLAKRLSHYEIPVAALMEPETELPLTDDELRFVGWFVTDGTMNRSNGVVSISQSVSQPHLSAIDACLQGCGFKYGRYLHKPKPGSSFANATDQIRFTISKGKPRGRDKHLRGWGALEPYLDKNLSPLLAGVSKRQLSVLLEAVHLGDGSKQLNQSWTRRSYHISTANRSFADRLQALCVLRGWRCNVADIDNATQKILMIHCKDAAVRAVGGATSVDRESFCLATRVPNERVWCVENRLGTIIIRRNGKVAVVGNCGRVLRPHPGKTRALIHDHGGNILRHGLPLDDRDYSLTADRKRNASAKHMACPLCSVVVPLSATECPSCGGLLRAPCELTERREMRVRAEAVRLNMEQIRAQRAAQGLRTMSDSDLARIATCSRYRACAEYLRLRNLCSSRGYPPHLAAKFYAETFQAQPDFTPAELARTKPATRPLVAPPRRERVSLE